MRFTLTQQQRINRLYQVIVLDSSNWDESKHPRKKNGQFGKGGSQSAMKSVKANIKRGQEAMNTAIAEKRTVHRAMYNQELGWIDFEWGDTGTIKPNGKTKGAMGIAHIIEARMRKDNMSYQQATKMLTSRVVETVAKGKTSHIYESGKVKSVFVDYNGNRATLIKRIGSNSWLMNAFELKSTGEQVGSNDPSLPTQTLPTRQRQGMGAVDEQSVTQNRLLLQQRLDNLYKRTLQ